MPYSAAALQASPDSKLADELSLFSIHLILIELSPQDTAKTWKTWTPTLLVRIGVGLTENLWKRQLRRQRTFPEASVSIFEALFCE